MKLVDILSKKQEKLELSENSIKVLESRYLKKKDGLPIEKPEEMFLRVAECIASVEKTYRPYILEEEYQEIKNAFYNLMGLGYFMPNSPTLMNAGRDNGHSFSACIHGDSNVLTSTGYISMKEVVDKVNSGEEIIVSNGFNQWVPVLAVKSNGVKDVYRVHTNSGRSVECTMDHKFYSSKEIRINKGRRKFDWNELENLQEGSYLYYGEQSLRDDSDYSEEELHEIIIAAWTLTDGCCGNYKQSKGNSDYFVGEIQVIDKESLKYVKKSLDFLEIKYTEIEVDIESVEQFVRLRSYDRKWEKLCKKYELFERKTKKHVSRLIKRASLYAKKEFLRSVFEADGWISKSGVGFRSCSYTLVKEISQILDEFGVPNQVKFMKENRVGRLDGWNIMISHSDSISLFKERVGFISKRKNKKLKEFPFPEKPRVKIIIIEEIESLGKDEVFDIQTSSDENGSFVVDGIVVHNCYVLPIEDSIDGIFTSIKNTAIIQKAGGGTGFNFGSLRSKGTEVRSSGGTTSGPISFLKVFSEATNAIQQGAFRRGANMGVMQIDHPDIIDFIEVKKDLEQLNNYNLSVAITDSFMEILRDTPSEPHIVHNEFTGKKFKLDSRGKVWTVSDVWQLILERAWETGEPGILFIDEINKYNPTPHIGRMEATNPCLSGDTKVLTSSGLLRIRDIVGKKVSLYYDGLFFDTTDAGFFSSGSKDVYILKTKEGFQIKLTKDHKLMDTSFRMIKASDFKKGDKLISSFGYDLFFDSLELLGKEEVFDCQVPGVNKFDANGFVSSNCGELPLLPYEACNLGSINVSMFVKDKEFDFDEFSDVIMLGIKFLDNIIDANNYPIPEIEHMCKANRKIGLGVMGFADALFKLGIPYDSEEGVEFGKKIMSFVKLRSHQASVSIAEQRGVFPNWQGSLWDTTWKKDVRNASVTCIAPTGTISIISDCSGGIEPMFSLAFFRNVLNGQKLTEVNRIFKDVAQKEGFYSEELIEEIAQKGSLKDISSVPDHVKKVFVTARDISPEWHVKMQAAFQDYTDNSISKTINFDHNAKKEDIQKVYDMAYDLNLKGCTIYRDGCRKNQPMALSDKKAKLPLPSEPIALQDIMSGVKVKQFTPFGNMHIYLSIDSKTKKEVEVFAQLGKAGDVASSDLEAICRLISLFLRNNGNLQDVINQLSGIGSVLAMPSKDGLIKSLADALSKGLQKYQDSKEEFVFVDSEDLKHVKDNYSSDKGTDQFFNVKCPECMGDMTFGEGCMKCNGCGFSKC